MIIADLRIYMAKFEKRLFAPPCRICILITALCQVGIHGPPHWLVWNDQKLASLDLGRWNFQAHFQPILAALTGPGIPVSANIPRKRLTIRRQTTRTKSFRKKSRKSIMGDSSTPSKGQLLDTDLQLLDMAPFGRKVIAFNKLIRRELELMNLVLPLEFHQEVLNIIVSSSLQEISNDAQKILIQLDESLKVPEYGALLELCPAIGQLKSVSSPIVHALRLASDKNRSTIQKIIRDLELKGSDILDDFEDNVKSGSG